MEKILVAVDHSARAPLVLDTAVDLARRLGAKLHVVHVVGIAPEISLEKLPVSPEGARAALLGHAKEALRGVTAALPAELVGGEEVRIGSPWSAICSAAEDLGAELIVIGSHGYSGLDRILGTTASKVVNHARCSVLVVRGRL